MTLIVGWKNNKGAFIAGDSIISSTEGHTENQITSFGESTNTENIIFKETCLKVDVLCEKIIIAGAGSDREYRNFIRDLNRKLELLDDDLVSLINQTLDEYNRFASCSLIFAFRENEVTHLLSYNDNLTQQTILKEVEDFVYAGSIEEPLIEIITPVSGLLSKINFPNDKTMVSLCAILQSFVLQHPQIENGIGGLFTGAYVDTESIKWMDDTTFILYNKGFGTENSGTNISVALRDNGVFIYTPQEGVENKIFLNTHSLNPENEILNWGNKHYEETNKKVNTSDSAYIVFIHTTNAIVSILESDFSQYVKVVSTSELRREYAFSSEWMNKLFTQRILVDAKKDEGYPFTFNWGWN